MARKYKKITYQDRKILELYIKAGITSQSFLASEIGVNRSTICREMKRGKTKDGIYNAELAQQRLKSKCY